MLAIDLLRSGFRLRCRLGRTFNPLESDSLLTAATRAVELGKAGRWLK